jgi:hypothetical protein
VAQAFRPANCCKDLRALAPEEHRPQRLKPSSRTDHSAALKRCATQHFDFARVLGYTAQASPRFLPAAYATKFQMNRFAEIPMFFPRAARFHGSAKLSLVLILLVLISGVLVGAPTG